VSKHVGENTYASSTVKRGEAFMVLLVIILLLVRLQL
jgi:hypothetical protein